MAWVKRLVVLVLLGLASCGIWIRHLLTSSLPSLDGEMAISRLSAPVTIERDALGVATIRGEDRRDVSRALGFVHAQERFFQMDLQRRRAAGELAELLGESALALDRRHRLHRMRSRAKRSVQLTSAAERELLDAYTEGVNAGLDALGVRPFEYLLLGQDPASWRSEDSVLVVSSMFFELNDTSGRWESTVGLLHDVLPEELARFLTPRGTRWDAPVLGTAFATPPVPGPDAVESVALPASSGRSVEDFDENIGSNNWAVAGNRSAHGGGLLACDMHLRHSVPNIWYRALLAWGTHRVVGVTLPGVPFIVAGSNGHVAWGFTNSNGDWVDLVELEMHSRDAAQYRTPDGYRPLEVHEERISVADGEARTLEVRETIWGPIIDEDHRGRPRALRWIGHEDDAVNVVLRELETAANVDEALEIGQRAGMPPQNLVCVDASGAIGWTIAGRMPSRFGFEGRLPSSWADGERGWDGWREPEQYPVIRDPEGGFIWTANARVVDGEMLEKIGDGGYAFGARARQIRDGLRALERPSERDMLDIQLDHRAIFMEEWRDYFLQWVEDPVRTAIAESWTGHASPDSAGYRIVRELRLAIFQEVFGALTKDARTADERFSPWSLRQWDGPLWKLVSEKPEHLVPPRYESWDAWMEDIVARTVSTWDGPLDARTWGAANTSAVRHPLSRAVPLLSRWLDMPPRPLPGDSNMPRAQAPSHGASQRLVVSPGREEHGLFHMPGGQSGHPLSPFYGAGHQDWEEGRPTPLMPGSTEYTLTLSPK